MRGSITLGQAVGVGITLLLASVGGFIAEANRTDSNIGDVKDAYTAADTNILQRVASLEAKMERVPFIESKLDALLQQNGLNPKLYSK